MFTSDTDQCLYTVNDYIIALSIQLKDEEVQKKYMVN